MEPVGCQTGGRARGCTGVTKWCSDLHHRQEAPITRINFQRLSWLSCGGVQFAAWTALSARASLSLSPASPVDSVYSKSPNYCIPTFKSAYPLCIPSSKSAHHIRPTPSCHLSLFLRFFFHMQ